MPSPAGFNTRWQSVHSSSEAQSITSNSAPLLLRWNAAATADLPLPDSPMMRIGSLERRLARAGASHRAEALNGVQSSAAAVWLGLGTADRRRRFSRNTIRAPT